VLVPASDDDKRDLGAPIDDGSLSNRFDQGR
jgi:hypothetical protein